MVTTRGSETPDAVTTQLAAIAAKLEAMSKVQEEQKSEMAELKRRSDKSPNRSWKEGDGETSGGGGRQHRPFNKIDFPTFHDGDPRGWILKAEKYFRYYNIADWDKVDVASMHLDGNALDLYSWVTADQEITEWEDLVHVLQKNFGPAEFQNPDEHLCSIRQTGTVQEYRQEFARRSSRVSNWGDHCLLGVFLNGLKEELKTDVRIHKPRTVYKAMSLALEYETKMNQAKPGRSASGSPFSKQPTTESKPSNVSSLSTGGLAKQPLRITDNEKQSRFLRGECFRCGDKYGPGHRCKAGTFKLLNAEEEIEGDAAQDETVEEDQARGEAEISLHAILGKFNPTTMKVHGLIGEQEVLILIDGGSTHNFVSDVLVKELHLSTMDVSPFGVQIGNGDVIRCSKVCKELKIHINGLQLTQDFYPFSIGGADLVLGIQWLATLNTVQVNWREMFMIFNIDGKRYKWQGITSGPQKSSTFQHLAIESGDNCEVSPPFQPMVQKYALVFDEPKSLPPVRTRTHAIRLVAAAAPPNIRPYRYPFSQKEEIERQVAQLLEAGFIQPSTSPFSSPVLLVRKKDRSWRMCVDYRALNQITVADKYPIPTIDELLDELHGAVIFSKLDLRSGYYQIRMHENDVQKTAFRTHSGHYEFNVMPFGLTNAPSTFQAVMNDLFRPYLRKFVLVFFDDILIYSRSLDEHWVHLETTLSLLLAHSFFAKLSKCCFGQETVIFLGHRISAEGVHLEQEKVGAIQSWPVPTTVKEVRGFLGLTGYYRRFVRNYGIIARPLTALTKKDGFVWSEDAYDAFQNLKAALISAPVLQLPDFSKEFVVECDASSEGVGAILSQNDHPVAYFSKGFSPANRFKSAYDRELLALVLAVQKWNHYLLGRRFIIKTDHYTLKFLLEQRITTTEQQRLLLKLMPYEFSIVHRAGKENKGADALSRRPQSGAFLALSMSHCGELDEIKAGLFVDSWTKEKMQQVLDSPSVWPDYSIANQLLFYKDRLVVPQILELKRKLIAEAHSTAIGGHGGFLKTLKRISERFFWKGMKSEVRTFIQNCLICQQNKYETLSPAGLLQPLPIPERLWEDVSMDFVIGLPKSNKYDTVMVVVDRMSKYAHFVALSHPFTAKKVADIFCREIVRLHGIPRSIVSDRDAVFVSSFWQELFRLNNTNLKLSTSYHPQTDGQTEVTNRWLEGYLRCFVQEQPKRWSFFLPWAEYSYNTGFHTSAQTTPFKSVYGRDPPPLIPYLKGETKNEELEQQLLDRDALLINLQQNLRKAQDRMRTQANQKRRDVNYEEGEYVFLKLQPYRQHSLATRRFQKLSPRFFGPYRIKRRIGEVAYELELPPTARIHPIFHVSLLKKARGHPVPTNAAPLPITTDWELEVQPMSVRGHRWITVAGAKQLELLIQWSQRPVEESSWEPYDLIAEQFPNFRLEDKASFDGGSDDTILSNQASDQLKVYARRKKKSSQQARGFNQLVGIFGHWLEPLSGGEQFQEVA